MEELKKLETEAIGEPKEKRKTQKSVAAELNEALLSTTQEEEHKDRSAGQCREREEREGILRASTAEEEEEEPEARELERDRGVADPPKEKERTKARAPMAQVKLPLMLSKSDRDRPEKIDREAAMEQEPKKRKTEADEIAGDQKDEE